jgi:uncharacterized LabA/DUF88 family protein
MRVALFFDGKNHMKDLRRTTQDRWIDHSALADFVVSHVGGTRFVGGHYYTGVPNPNDDHGDRHALTDLLEELEKRPGFFVKRFNRRTATRDCPHCGQVIAYTEEKMVDTSLAVDLVTLAMRDVFDAAVVFSGDLDVAPALTALRALGKQAWIATFGDYGLSRSLVREAWSHIDLLAHLESFAHPMLVDPRATPPGGNGQGHVHVHGQGPTATGHPDVVVVPRGGGEHSVPIDVDREVLRELRRAELHFAAGGGFVGAHYFIHRWKGHAIPETPDARRQAVQRLLTLGRAETYTVDGKTALRVAEGALSEEHLELASLTIDDEEQTVEMRLSETLVRRLRARLDES